VAAAIGLVPANEVIEAIRGRPEGVEVVLTGRNAPQGFIELADYVSEIANKKHPFDSGQKARKGVEW
jgi:cob(I)alamin adenosyltransferase